MPYWADGTATFLSFQKSTNILQKKILEYVPIAIPKIIQRTKSFVVTPPQKYSANNVINVVNDVLILLVKV